MASLELRILSNVIRNGDLKHLKERNITAAHFETRETKDLFTWLSQQYMDPASPGVVPSLERVMRYHPTFEYCPTADGLPSLVDDLVRAVISEKLLDTIDDAEAAIQEGEDPQQFIANVLLPELRDLSIEGSRDRHLSLKAATDMLEEEFFNKKATGGITGIPYPWAPMNQALGGMNPEEFIVFYARPKNMKTWLACAIAADAFVNSNRRVLVYSKEMSSIVMARRVASCVAKVDYEELKSGTIPDEDAQDFFDSLRTITELQSKGGDRKAASIMFMSDRGASVTAGAATVDKIYVEAEKFGADLVIVDGFYLIKDGRTNVRSRDWKQIANISSDLKQLAQTLKVPVVGTTQANRTSVGSRGDDLSELGFSDAIGQDADVVARLFKSINRKTRKPKILLTFPGVRDSGSLAPFVVNAHPGVDFSVLQTSVSVSSFLKDKEAADAEEAGQEPEAAEPKAAKKFGRRKKAGSSRIK